MLSDDGISVGPFDLIIEEPPSEEEQWFMDVYERFILARAYGDVATWLKDAKGPNAALMRSQCKRLQQAALVDLRNLAQRAYMLWGVNIPLPKGLKDDGSLV